MPLEIKMMTNWKFFCHYQAISTRKKYFEFE